MAPRERSVRGNGMDAMRPPPRAILNLPGELSACGIDILAAGLAHGRREPCILQDLLEGDNATPRARPEFGARERIKRDQVELARHVANALDEGARLFRSVVDAVQHHVF